MAWTTLAHSRDCADGKCPTIRQDETGTVRVRGYIPDLRPAEQEIEFTAKEWGFLVAQLPRCR